MLIEFVLVGVLVFVAVHWQMPFVGVVAIVPLLLGLDLLRRALNER